MEKRRKIFGLFGLLVSIFFVWFAIRDADFSRIGRAFSEARLSLIPAFIAVYFVYFWLKAIRWRTLLRPVAESATNELFSEIMIGYTGNIVLPLRLGDAIRIYLASKRLKVSGSAVLSTFILEHVLDLLTISGVLAIAVMLSPLVPPLLVATTIVMASIGIALVALVLLMIRRTTDFLSLTKKLASPLPSRAREKLLSRVELAVAGFRALDQPRLYIFSVLISVLQWLVMCAAIFISLQAFHIQVAWSAVFFIVAVDVLVIMLPTTPGDIGVLQFAYSLTLVPYGINPSDAFSASVFFTILANASVVTLGTFFLWRMGYSLRGIRTAAEAKEIN